jgi:hypothetical protein
VSIESEKDLVDLLGTLDNHNRMRILKFLWRERRVEVVLVISTL